MIGKIVSRIMLIFLAIPVGIYAGCIVAIGMIMRAIGPDGLDAKFIDLALGVKP